MNPFCMSNHLLFLLFSLFLNQTCSQQPYVNKQNDCHNSHAGTDGNRCNGPKSSCLSYLTFRTQPPYNTATEVARLLNVERDQIVRSNDNINEVDAIPTDTLIIVPITNCSCSGNFYQYNSSYTLKNETYFLLGETYQGLTTCIALINQNPGHLPLKLSPGIRLSVPLRCACPTKNQTARGIHSLLSYLIVSRDTIPVISEAFGVDAQSILDANQLSNSSIISPSTSLLVPFKLQPTYRPPRVPLIIYNPSPAEKNGSRMKIWVFVSIGTCSILVVVLLFGSLYFFMVHRQSPAALKNNPPSSTNVHPTLGHEPQFSIRSSVNVHNMIKSSLNEYSFEELQTATGSFKENSRIKGSVYSGVTKDGVVAIKRMEGNAPKEIYVLNKIHHSSFIKLSGYCAQGSHFYCVYEFAENGSLSDWVHGNKLFQILTWTQRIQIACDVADGLNYLHNYASPPYILNNLRSSHILLTRSFRAKIANLGMACTITNGEEGTELIRNVVGTQGYMAPEYIETGIASPETDIFAFGVMMLELISGRDAVTFSDDRDKLSTKGGTLLFQSINDVLEGENVREKLRSFIDPSLKSEYPLGLAFSVALLANNCTAKDLSTRPNIFDISIALSKILSKTLEWDRLDALQRTYHAWF
ncbi:hypothetical protein ACHQM5_017563 [Ranunculus cassubicifolius]